MIPFSLLPAPLIFLCACLSKTLCLAVFRNLHRFMRMPRSRAAVLFALISLALGVVCTAVPGPRVTLAQPHRASDHHREDYEGTEPETVFLHRHHHYVPFHEQSVHIHEDGSETHVNFHGHIAKHLTVLEPEDGYIDASCSADGAALTVEMGTGSKLFQRASTWTFPMTVVVPPGSSCNGEEAVYFKVGVVDSTSPENGLVSVLGRQITVMECFMNAKGSISHYKIRKFNPHFPSPSSPLHQHNNKTAANAAAADERGDTPSNSHDPGINYYDALTGEKLSRERRATLRLESRNESGLTFGFNARSDHSPIVRSLPLFQRNKTFTGGSASLSLTCEDCVAALDVYYRVEFEVGFQLLKCRGLLSWTCEGPRVWIQFLRLTVGAEATVDLTLLLRGNLQLSRTFQRTLIPEFNIGKFRFFIGPLPVWIDFKGQLDGRVIFSLEAEGTASAGLRYSAYYERGVEYRNNKVTPFGSSSGSFVQKPFTTSFHASASIRVYLIPILKISVNSLIHSEVHLQPYAQVTIGLNRDVDRRACTTTGLAVGGHLTAGATVVLNVTRVGVKFEYLDKVFGDLSIPKPYFPLATPELTIIPEIAVYNACLYRQVQNVMTSPNVQVMGFSEDTVTGYTCADAVALSSAVVSLDECAQFCNSQADCFRLIWSQGQGSGPNCFKSLECSELVPATAGTYVISKLDVCATENGNCDSNAHCTAGAPGERTCMCSTGFEGDGITCTAVTVCSDLTSCGVCFDNPTCVWCDSTSACQRPSETCTSVASSSCTSAETPLSSLRLRIGSMQLSTGAIYLGHSYTLEWEGGTQGVSFGFSYDADTPELSSEKWFMGLGLTSMPVTNTQRYEWNVPAEGLTTENLYVAISSESDSSNFQTVGPFVVLAPPPPEGEWESGEWGPCSGSCGNSNTQQRTVSCVDANTRLPLAVEHCESMERPALVRVCNVFQCTSFTHDCGNPTYIQNAGGCEYVSTSSRQYVQAYYDSNGDLFCRRANDITCKIHDDIFGCNNIYCCAPESPYSFTNLNPGAPSYDFDVLHPCSNAHWTKEPGPCSRSCGGGVRSLQWACRIMPGDERHVQIPTFCPTEDGYTISRDGTDNCRYASNRDWCATNDGFFDGMTFHPLDYDDLPSSEECNTHSCEEVSFQIEVETWSECSAPCGGGTETAVPICVSSAQEQVALSNCVEQLQRDSLMVNSLGLLTRPCNMDACTVSDLVLAAPSGAEIAQGTSLLLAWTGGELVDTATVSVLAAGEDEVFAETVSINAARLSATVLLPPTLIPRSDYRVRLCLGRTCAVSDQFTIYRENEIGDPIICSSLCSGDCTGSLPSECNDCRYFSLDGGCVRTCPIGYESSEGSMECTLSAQPSTASSTQQPITTQTSEPSSILTTPITPSTTTAPTTPSPVSSTLAGLSTTISPTTTSGDDNGNLMNSNSTAGKLNPAVLAAIALVGFVIVVVLAVLVIRYQRRQTKPSQQTYILGITSPQPMQTNPMFNGQSEQADMVPKHNPCFVEDINI